MHVLKGDQSSNSCQPLGDQEVWAIFRQVTKGLQYLHQQVGRSVDRTFLERVLLITTYIHTHRTLSTVTSSLRTYW